MEVAEIYANVVEDSEGHYQVGMDPCEFFEAFMPWGNDIPLDFKQAKLPEVARKRLCSVPPREGEDESSMYSKYVSRFLRLKRHL